MMTPEGAIASSEIEEDMLESGIVEALVAAAVIGVVATLSLALIDAILTKRSRTRSDRSSAASHEEEPADGQ